MTRTALYMVNGITLYRIITAPLLLWLAIDHRWEAFRWLLMLSFLTDAVDGYIARRYRVTSRAGAVLDSIGDDLTVAVAIAGFILFDPVFFRRLWIPALVLVILWLTQLSAALIRYRRPTSFHTALAKVAAVLQAVFLIGCFFLPAGRDVLFWTAGTATALDLVEETMMIFLLPQWQPDVKGIVPLLRARRRSTSG